MKLAKIELNDFRAFPGPQTYTFDLADGRNLLLYGENGSGKSSLYRALVEFFRLDSQALPFHRHRNIFSGGGEQSRVDGHVTLTLTDGTVLEWTCLGQRPQHTSTVPQALREFIADTAYRKSFLEYRSLLRTNFTPGDLREQLFTLAVEHLLANVPVILGGGRTQTVGQLWATVLDSFPSSHRANALARVGRAVNEFNTGVQSVLPDVEKMATDLLGYFTGADLTVRLNLPGVRYNGAKRTAEREFVDRHLEFEITLNGEKLPVWNDFLNEARLSALALSLYFASTLLSNPAPPPGVSAPLKLIVLDDVLIGLDLSNRLPVLRLLEERFADYQIILLTFDKVWFELAQLELESTNRWISCEMHTGTAKAGGFTFDVPVVRPQNSNLAKHFLNLAEHHLNVRYDSRTAALHARAAFEVKLKSYCSRHKVQVPYDHDERRLNTDHFLQAVERRLWWTGTMPRALFALQHVKLFRHGVLNPLAHFHPVTLAKPEVAAAIRAVRELTFPDKKCDFAKMGADLLKRSTLNAAELIDAACWLRTAFEVDVRVLLKNHGGQVSYRDDWTKITRGELWDAAKETMNRVNPAAAGSLIADIETHRGIFLDEWRFDRSSGWNKSDLDAAWRILKEAGTVPRTRLGRFA